MGSSTFAAGESAVGYLYQCKYALSLALARYGYGDLKVTIEGLDDIQIGPDDAPEAVLQLKHHDGQSPANLTDSSVDLWKTLRVWMETIVDPAPKRFLVTTSACSDGTAVQLLRQRDPDVNRVAELLLQVAANSKNEKNEKAYQLFIGMKDGARIALLNSIQVLDCQPLINDVDAELDRLLRPASPRHVVYVRQRIVEWWYSRCVDQLSKKNPAPITQSEIDEHLELITDSLRSDNLPVDTVVPHVSVADYEQAAFMRQLSDIGIGGSRLLRAAEDYMRAFTQRSKWLGDELLSVGELGNYESRLVDEWRVHFSFMCDELGMECTEDAIVSSARDLYRWVELEANFPIRARLTDRWVSRGSFHMLANALRIGWHRDFESRYAVAGEETA